MLIKKQTISSSRKTFRCCFKIFYSPHVYKMLEQPVFTGVFRWKN